MPPYSPESNGVAERKYQTLTDLVNAMLDNAGLFKSWWGEALLTASLVLNRVPNRNEDQTPYEIWIGRETIAFLLAHMGMLGESQCPNQQERQVGT